MTKNDPPNKPRTGKKQESSRDAARVGPASTHNANLYGWISLISFVCGVAVLVLLLWKADVLTRLGLVGKVYYVALLPLGLCAAGFLFGAMRSFAGYKGKHLGGVLELGGPVVAFVLVVGGGFVLVPKPPSTFPLTVYVHGGADHTNTVLRNTGDVLIDLDGDRQSRSIGGNGEAYFPAIPDHFRGQMVPAWVEADGFEATHASERQRIDGGSLYLSVRQKSERIAGRVQDQDGNPIGGAELSMSGLSARSDASGYFELSIPGDKVKREMNVQVTASGYSAKTYKVEPGANDLTVTLEPRTKAP